MSQSVFITGSTGYMGSRLIPVLLRRGHRVTALVRPKSQGKLKAVSDGRAEARRSEKAYFRMSTKGSALKMDSYVDDVRGADTFVHLIGVAHPNPAKAARFRTIDLVSIQVALKAARDAGVRHFVYLSVAQPAPVMKAFVAVRAEGEAMIRASGIVATFLRPWYVLGPGHRWPYALLPIYRMMERLPRTRESAERLGLVTIQQMLNALLWSVENPPVQLRIIDVPQIRALDLG
jgi:uncharacterized protein YbjT (DUF2867 family)